ncbi:MAG: hypothetical protein LC679_01670 [Intrasporangiaceae bacterium]|nr:hypothetical protein [Intrasporangiaceae bacterium]
MEGSPSRSRPLGRGCRRSRPARIAPRRVWVIDPLDGTRESHDLARSDWAVHVALVVDGVPVAGAVALPARGLTLATRPAPGPLPPLPSKIRLVVSRTRPASSAGAIAAALDADLDPMGSAGAKTAAVVVLGEAEAYVHDGGQHEWDSAAPVAVGMAMAAGLHVSRLDGSPFPYNQSDPWPPDLLICRSALADAVIAAARGGCAGRSPAATESVSRRSRHGGRVPCSRALRVLAPDPRGHLGRVDPSQGTAGGSCVPQSGARCPPGSSTKRSAPS